MGDVTEHAAVASGNHWDSWIPWCCVQLVHMQRILPSIPRCQPRTNLLAFGTTNLLWCCGCTSQPETRIPLVYSRVHCQATSIRTVRLRWCDSYVQASLKQTKIRGRLNPPNGLILEGKRTECVEDHEHIASLTLPTAYQIKYKSC